MDLQCGFVQLLYLFYPAEHVNVDVQISNFLELTGSRDSEYINLIPLIKPSPSASADDLSEYILK